MQAYKDSLELYARIAGCVGSSCTRIGELPFYATVSVLSLAATSLRARGQDCALARLPTRHFEPGVCAAPLRCNEYQDLCATGISEAFIAVRGIVSGLGAPTNLPDENVCFVAAIIKEVHVGVIRALHLSNTKQRYSLQYPEDPALIHCPLLAFLLEIALGRVSTAEELAVVRAAADRATGCWSQQKGDFLP